MPALGLPCACVAECCWRKHPPCWLISCSWHWPAVGPEIVKNRAVHSFFYSPMWLFSLPSLHPYLSYWPYVTLKHSEENSTLSASICTRTWLSFLSHQIPCAGTYSGTFFLPSSSSPKLFSFSPGPFPPACKHVVSSPISETVFVIPSSSYHPFSLFHITKDSLKESLYSLSVSNSLPLILS